MHARPYLTRWDIAGIAAAVILGYAHGTVLAIRDATERMLERVPLDGGKW